MFASIGDISKLAFPTAAESTRRTGQPVRRNSYAKGREGTFWRPIKRQEVRQIVLAAKKYDLTTRQPGTRNGALGHIALEVLELLANLVSFKTGQLDPSLDWLKGKLRRSKDAIVRALKALRAHGFLDWLRRYVPTGNEGQGPRVQQTSNAYRLTLPARALRLLGRQGQTPPAPDDFTHARAAAAAEIEAHKATLTPAELALFVHGDTPLGLALARLGGQVERESATRSESRSKSII